MKLAKCICLRMKIEATEKAAMTTNLRKYVNPRQNKSTLNCAPHHLVSEAVQSGRKLKKKLTANIEALIG